MSYASALFHLSMNMWSALHAAVSSERCGISSAGLYLVYQHRYCHQEFFCSLLLRSRTIFAFRRFKAGNVWSLGPVSAMHRTCIRINGSPSYSGPFGARLVHVGIVVFSFYRDGPTTLLGQESTLSAIVVVPIEFSTSQCMRSQLLQRCPFFIARVPFA